MLYNIFLLAITEIRRNFLRSFLTTLGITIGVATVIIIVTLGSGAAKEMTQQINQLGSNLLIITPGQKSRMGQRSNAKSFKSSDVKAIRQAVNSIAIVSASSTKSITAVFANKNWISQVTGIDHYYFHLVKWKIKSGRLFNHHEFRNGSTVCIIGATISHKLFGSKNPIGKKIRLARMSCQVIAVLAAKSKSPISLGINQDELVLLPLTSLQRRIAGNNEIHLIQVAVNTKSAKQKTQMLITKILRQRRHITSAQQDDFSVMDMKEVAKMLNESAQVLTLLLITIAAISLFVGGIGIMNIMLVSISARTQEIGIRLAIGALSQQILLQFLIEAVLLSVLGGVIGIILAVSVSYFLSHLIQLPFVFDANIVIIAFLFSAAIGILFGYFPARRAACLDPIEALRHE